MAKQQIDGIPNYKERQKLLYVEKAPPERLGEIADMLIAEGRHDEAFDYIQRMGNEERLDKFMEDAKSRGDYFNFDRAARALDVEVDAKDWEELGIAAEHNGLLLFAVESYRRAGNRGRARELIAKNPDFFGPALEMERGMQALMEEGVKEAEQAAQKQLPEPEEPEAPPEPEQPKVEKDPLQAAREAALKARKKKWRKKK